MEDTYLTTTHGIHWNVVDTEGFIKDAEDPSKSGGVIHYINCKLVYMAVSP